MSLIKVRFQAFWFVPAIGLALCASSVAQDSRRPPPVRIPFRIESEAASPQKLTARDFVLLEDGQEREISGLDGGDADTRPLELTLLFDTGMLVGWTYRKDSFTKTRLDRLPVAGVAIYGFENLLMPFCLPTRDPKVLAQALGRVRHFMDENLSTPGEFDHAFPHSAPPAGTIAIAESFYYGATDSKLDGTTAVYAAIRAALHAQASHPGDARRGLVVFGRSDPGMRAVKPAQVTALAIQLGIYVYPVRMLWEWNHDTHVKGWDPPFLALGPATGGAAFAPEWMSSTALEEILNQVANCLRSAYAVKFQPTASGSPTTHQLQVRLRSHVSATIIGGSGETLY